MAIEKMSLIRIVGQSSALDDVLGKCYKSKCFHIEEPAKSAKASDSFVTLNEVNPYTEILEKLKNVFSSMNYKPKKVDFDESSQDIEQSKMYIENIDRKMSELIKLQADLKSALEEYSQTLLQVNHLVGFDANFKDVFSCEHIKIRFGRLPADSFPKLEYYSKEDFVFIPFNHDEDYYWGVYFTPSVYEEVADDIFASLYFERLRIPGYLLETLDKAIAGVNRLIDTTNEELYEINSRISQVKENEKEHLNILYSMYLYKNEVFKLRKKAAILGDEFYIIGFVPKKQVDSLVNEIDKDNRTYASEIPNDSDMRLKAPTKLKNNALVRPFEQIVKMYGIPRYGEFDPTVYVAITYTLLFGIMFGDLGQGLVIFLVGLIMSKVKKMEFGKVLERIGLSSAVFGTVYGSVFGFENALDPIYKSLFGLEEKPVDVFKQSNMLLIAAVGMGVLFISISILLNIIFGIKRHDYEDAVFGPNGIAGFVFYVSILMAVVLKFLFKINVLNPVYVLLLIVIPLLLVFFKQPLGKLLKHKKDIKPSNGIGEFIAENFFEMFEYLLSYATNTMSFLRVGGFILSHAGMMLVVFSLSEAVSSAASPVVIIIGNIFVMALEGLIVGIQSLRLQFYEIFGRFFTGGGTVYSPIGADEETKNK